MKKLLTFIPLMLLFITSQAVETGASCTSDDDCPDLHTCFGTTSRTCVHKPLFPITVREVFATIINVVLNSFLTAGGVGAGAAYVPYVILLFRTTLSHAIYIAYLCVFGGGLGNLVNIIGLRNPKTKRFMTNYSLNMIVLPALMTGIMIGLILQRVFPPLVTHLILLMTLAYALKKNYGKLKSFLAKERKDKEVREEAKKVEDEKASDQTVQAIKPEKQELAAELSLEPAKLTDQSVLDKSFDVTMVKKPDQSVVANTEGPVVLAEIPVEKAGTVDKGSMAGMTVITKESEMNLAKFQDLEPQKEEEKSEDPLAEKKKCIMEKEQRFPFYKLRETLYIIIVIILIGIIRGSKTFKPVVGVEWSCGWDFIWFSIAIVVYGLLLARSLYLVLKWQKEKQEVGYEFLPEEPLIDKQKAIKLVIVATIAGSIGAIVALGGSMIVGPTLLDFGMPPAFSAATTGYFMIFAMFNTVFNAILSGKVTGQELAWFIPLSFLMSYSSSLLVNWYVKKTGKQSVIIKCIMLVAALGFVCLLAIMIQGLVEDTKTQITFTNVC